MSIEIKNTAPSPAELHLDGQIHSNVRAVFDISKFKRLYDTFSINTLSQLPGIYSQDIDFIDPIHQLHGLDNLRSYFENFCASGSSCRFEFQNEIVGEQQAFFQWHMHYCHPRLKDGANLTLRGSTVIYFNSHVFYHEDFYDMGAMIYQHIPVLGWAIKKVNARLTTPNNNATR